MFWKFNHQDAKKIKLAEDVDFHTVARMASCASGTELANIVNEAALRAVRSGRRFATQADLEELSQYLYEKETITGDEFMKNLNT